MTPLERFWAKVDRSELSPGGCWPWTGSRDPGGYGYFWDGTRGVRAHRLALVYAGVDVPPEGMVLHRCDQPPCVNPDHLRVGTGAENRADYLLRGRPAYKLPPAQRRRYVCRCCGGEGHNQRTCDAMPAMAVGL